MHFCLENKTETLGSRNFANLFCFIDLSWPSVGSVDCFCSQPQGKKLRSKGSPVCGSLRFSKAAQTWGLRSRPPPEFTSGKPAAAVHLSHTLHPSLHHNGDISTSPCPAPPSPLSTDSELNHRETQRKVPFFVTTAF